MSDPVPYVLWEGKAISRRCSLRVVVTPFAPDLNPNVAVEESEGKDALGGERWVEAQSHNECYALTQAICALLKAGK